ncbi:MAG: acetyl-CoA carboxylase biotin carboxylase subunit [Gammaproteobacteria bacterium]|nr:acetyl-CoA carboxylase biotin carboxylase subunit [Gammaproteobacteria bacterium]MCP5198862.1 acetyl-CoA carboxylase biotin carboxylase subunit [Gammaproteobacteria bacterium]
MRPRPLRRVLIANRGEIAVRIARACFDEGLECVAAVSEADRDSLAARLADGAICIGSAAATASYLNIGAVVGAAIAARCDAIHPGYGFLSERAELAQACAEHGITFVGPPAAVIRRGGDKVAARRAARALGIPVGEGSDAIASVAEAGRIAADIGYPVLLKAAAGGGGRGMVQVRREAELEEAFLRASTEAQQAFGDGTLFLERYVTNARHVEIQVLADGHGQVVHLGERDCSCQRRYQKLVEEAPAAAVPAHLRAALGEAAVRLARALDYVGAGTMEFLVDLDREAFSFLEVNTRVQVEHPVTELVSGIDIVRQQLRIAGGDALGFTQDDVALRGHAVEVRINAEQPAQDFLPSPGRIERWTLPQGEGVRVDTHCHEGYVVGAHYDSMVAKLICHGASRAEALDRLYRALGHVRIEGIATTVPLLRDLVGHGDFRADRINTRWLEDHFLPAWTAAPGRTGVAA